MREAGLAADQLVPAQTVTAQQTDAGQTDAEQTGPLIHDIKTLDQATPHDLGFFENRRYLQALKSSRAGFIILSPDDQPHAPPGASLILSPEPYRDFARALACLYPDASYQTPAASVRRDASSGTDDWQQSGSGAHIHASAQFEEDVVIEPGAVIGAGAMIGRGTVIRAGAVIGERVYIGRQCLIGANAVISHSLIGNHVIIHNGAAIGQDGFGFAMGAGGHIKVPQIGRVIIQDHVEIGANSCVDRGALEDTQIGEGTKIDNLVQIAHNAVIGRHCVFAGQTAIAGSARLGDYVITGGHVAIAGHIEIGSGVQIAGGSKVHRPVPPGRVMGGYPAKDIKLWLKEVAMLKLMAMGKKTS